MTAIGAMPAGGYPPPTAADIAAMTESDVAAWSPDVWRWITGPYTGSTPLPILQWRALALVGYANRAAGALSVILPAAEAQAAQPDARPVTEPHSPAGIVAPPPGSLASSYTETPTEGGTGAPGFAPGSVDDPAYTSPTPVAGQRREPADPDAPGEGQQPVPETPEQP